MKLRHLQGAILCQYHLGDHYIDSWVHSNLVAKYENMGGFYLKNHEELNVSESLWNNLLGKLDGLEQDTHIGLFLAMIGTFGASTGNMVHQRNLNNNFPPIQTIAYPMLYGSLVTFLITQFRGAELLFEYSLSYISSLLYLSIFGSIFAFISYLKLLEKVGPGRAGYVGVVMPVLALIISTIFERLEWQIDLIIGLPILIIGAVLVINQKIKL